MEHCHNSKSTTEEKDMSQSESTQAPIPATTHPTQSPVTIMPPVTSPSAGALAPAASHPTHADTVMAPIANSDTPRDDSIRILQSDAIVEHSCKDLDWGSTYDEDGAFEKLIPKDGNFLGADLDLKKEDQAPMVLPTCYLPSPPHEVMPVAADALGYDACLGVVLQKASTQVPIFKQVEVIREDTHTGLGSDTESEEGIGDALTSPNTQASIQGMCDITTTMEVNKKFHSKPEVDLYPNASSKGADMFNGRKLQKKRAVDSDDVQTSGTPTSRRKAISTGGKGGGRKKGRGRGKLPSTAYRPMLHQMDKLPPGFI